MQAAAATFKQETTNRERVEWPQVATAALTWLTRIFGCWHQEMSRPFTLRSESYRVCLECGAHRRFDSEAWEMNGPYYYEPTASVEELYAHSKAATVRVMQPRRSNRPLFRAA